MEIFAKTAHQIVVASVFSIGLLTTFGTAANAACLAGGCRQNGLVFREASSSFTITDVVGQGTRENPFVVYQDVWGLDISLAITGLKGAPHHSMFNRSGFAISIVSRNLTNAFWRFYDHELQEIAGLSSSENDGLSFAQGIAPARPYTSNRYTQADEITDVRDFINFYRGAGVNPGESVRFNYFVTDTIPNNLFYIRQRPDYRPNTIPTPIVQRLAPLPTSELQPTPGPSQPVATTPQPVAPPPAPQTVEVPSSAPLETSAVIPAPATHEPAVPVPQPPAPSTPQVLAVNPPGHLETPAAAPQTVPESSNSIVRVLTIFLAGFMVQRKARIDHNHS